MLEIAVQVNGKLKGKFTVKAGSPNDFLEAEAKKIDNVQKLIEHKKINRLIIVPDRIVNFVID